MNSLHTVAIIQARMGSTRLPGKVMEPILGIPMIGHVVERTAHIGGVDAVVVATSNSERERPLVEYVQAHRQARLFRGPEQDVLARYVQAAHAFGAQAVVRITGDCPLLSPRVSSRVVHTFFDSQPRCDYVTNTLTRTYPRGLDTAVMSLQALLRAHREANSGPQREHVTPYIWSNPRKFRLVNVAANADRHHHRWTVDTAEDLRLVRAIFETVGEPFFEYEQALDVLEEHPELAQINAEISQKRLGR